MAITLGAVSSLQGPFGRTLTAALAPAKANEQPVTAADAMDILERARKEPEGIRAADLLAAARKKLDGVTAQQVDINAHIQQSMAKWGCFALCGSLWGSMLLLPKLGLQGNAVFAGLAIGFIGVPALAMWLVRQNGISEAKGQMTELDAQKKVCTAEVQQREQSLRAITQTITERLYKEAQARRAAAAPDPQAKVSEETTSVKIGNIVVQKRTAPTASA